jgi:tetratricopeptide (TPR) repeat protein
MPGGICQIPQRRLAFYVSSVLALGTLLLYWPTVGYDFIIVDDHVYVFQNSMVLKGISWGGFKWALSTMDAANWHPLTWMSHMLDCSIYGLFPGGHHLTNVFFHAANSVLLFLVLKRLTSVFWPSAFAAGLFAWHPLHVESVAWICERKDVLSGFFFLLTLWAYGRYVERQTRGRYFLALAFFLFGLMSKPMLVTLPCLLLLLDYWPLKRFDPFARQPDAKQIWWKLINEKIPFFFLSLLGCVMTMAAQSSGGAVSTTDAVPLLLRVTNAACSYTLYLAKAIWPANLAVFYPLPESPSWGFAAVSLLVMILITYAAFRGRSRLPWLTVGWLWFLGTLVPVIGLVQVGSQSMADRYTYIPYIGLSLMVVWSMDYWLKQKETFLVIAAAAGVAVLTLFAQVTRHQLGYWHDSVRLFRHAVQITAKNDFSDRNFKFSQILARQGDPLPRYEALLTPTPADLKARYYRSFDDASFGRLDSAVTELSETLNYDPRSDKLYNALGIVLAEQEKLDKSREAFQKASDLNPKSPWPYYNCAIALQEEGKADEALRNYSKALELRPAWPEALDKLAFLLATCPSAQLRNPTKAVQLATQANELTGGKSPGYLRSLAVAYAAAGSFSNAVQTAEISREKAQLAGFQNMTTNLVTEIESYRSGKIAPLDWKTPPTSVTIRNR